ncbi:MAG TPA: nitroreductase/quinone reductase family protein [Aldersonia sp.]
MNPVTHKLMSIGNHVMSALYRRSNGRIGGKAGGGVPVLLLTVRGRKSGQDRTTPVGYFLHDGAYVVAGSANGADTDPQWFRNLAHSDEARIRVRDTDIPVTVRIPTGSDRDDLWTNVVVATVPAFGKYEKKTDRTIPVAVLTPVS